MSSSSRTVILLNFNEREGVAPSDAARGLGDLGGDPSSTPALGEPTVVQGRFGNARSFDGTQGLVGTELTADQTKLRRTMAIEAIVTLDQAKASDGTRTILARGKLGGTGADRHLYALTVRTSAGKTYLELTWNNLSGGVIEFVAPPGWVYLAAVRRWISESEVEVEMFVNGVSIGVDTSADGAITDGDGGKVTVGCFASASGDPYQFFWEDAIDAIRVTRGEKTAEEIRHTYDRLFLFPQWGYELVKAFLPPGQAFSPNPDSVVQRELMIEGDALGEAWAHLEELRRYALPDQAWRTLDRWESILRLQPGPRETFAQRRLRVLGHIRRIHGFSVGEIVNAVAELLAVNADQLEVLENSNLVVDTWASGVGNRWYTYAGNGSVTGTSPGVDLVLTSGQSHDWTHLVQDAPHLRMPVVSDAKVEIIGKLDIPGSGFAEDGVAAGVFGYDFQSRSLHVFGVKRDAGANKWFHHLVRDGATTTTLLAGSVPAASAWIRLKRNQDGTVDFDYSTEGHFGAWTNVASAQASIGTIRSAGLTAMSDGAVAAARTFGFDECVLWTPEGTEVYRWYVYRDPALSGSPDMKGAQRVLDGMRPAHTEGTVTQTKSMKTGDPNSLCGRGPIGA